MFATFISLFLLSAPLEQKPGTFLFAPPTGWSLADEKSLKAPVKMMVVSKGKSYYPPSINLGIEPYRGTLKEYLSMMQNMNRALGSEWKEIGKLKTDAGSASLSQVKMRTEWGAVRLMHLVLIKDRTVYVLTAAALKEEFHLYYKQFFEAMKSIRLTPSLLEQIPDVELREQLKERINGIYSLIDKGTSFYNKEFQETEWKNFLSWLETHSVAMGPEWKKQLIEKLEQDFTVTYE